jgi:hypothetical protein
MGLSLILGWIWCPGCAEKNQGSVCTYKMFLADPAAAQRLVGLYIKLFLAGETHRRAWHDLLSP